MTKKLLISGILVSLLIFSLGLVGCGGGAGGGGEKPTYLRFTNVPSPGPTVDYSAWAVFTQGETTVHVKDDFSHFKAGPPSSVLYAVAGNSTATDEHRQSGTTVTVPLRDGPNGPLVSDTYDIWAYGELSGSAVLHYKVTKQITKGETTTIDYSEWNTSP